MWNRTAVLAMAFLVLFGSCAAFVIYYWLLKKMQPYQVATISLITPVVAVLEGALFAQEPIPFLMVIAIAIVLGSVGTVLLAGVNEQKNTDRILLVQE